MSIFLKNEIERRSLKKPDIDLQGLTRDVLGGQYPEYEGQAHLLRNLAVMQAIPTANPHDLNAEFAEVQSKLTNTLQNAGIADAEVTAKTIVDSYKAVKAPAIVNEVRARIPQEHTERYNDIARTALRTALLYALPGSLKHNSETFFQRNKIELRDFLESCGLEKDDAKTTANNITSAYKAAVSFEDKHSSIVA